MQWLRDQLKQHICFDKQFIQLWNDPKFPSRSPNFPNSYHLKFYFAISLYYNSNEKATEIQVMWSLASHKVVFYKTYLKIQYK